MKERTLRKKVGLFLLAAATMVSTVPKFTALAQEETEPPTVEQSIAVDDLRGFNTVVNDGTDDEAKIRLGNDNQEWWIVGVQDEKLILFAVDPIGEASKFEPNKSIAKSYDESWQCSYVDGTVPEKVSPNHYGASPIRTSLNDMVGSIFGESDRSAIVASTIYTMDTRDIQTNKIYSNTDKLYLPYGSYEDGHDTYVTVGTNTADGLEGGLRVDHQYWGNDDFWLRAPSMTYGFKGLIASGENQATFPENTDQEYAIKPAFALDLERIESVTCDDNGVYTLALNDGTPIPEPEKPTPEPEKPTPEPENPTPEAKPETKPETTDKNKAVKTGDNTSATLILVVATLSGGSALYFLKKRKKTK